MNIANMKIRTRLSLSFGVICTLLVFIVALSTTMLERVNEGADEIARNRLPKIEKVNGLLNQVDDVAIALRNMMLTEDKADRQRQLDAIMTARRNTSAQLEELQHMLKLPRTREALAHMIESNDKYVKGQDELIRQINSGAAEEAKTYLNKELRPMLQAYKQAVSEQVKEQGDVARAAAASAEKTYVETRNLMIGLGLAILALAAAMGYWITVSITRPVAEALRIANTVAAGDLSSRIEVSSTDEMGQLLRALKTMNESLVQTVSAVRAGTETIASASSQVASGNQDLSARTEQQAGSLEETASSMEELTSTVQKNAENARQATTLAMTASSVATKGGQVIGEVVDVMDEINTSAIKIADITSVIDGIAFQTNILALNAAVEAARAGDQGRGFAVVASEVRALAQRSANAAREVKLLISDSVEKVEDGSKLVKNAGTTMREIVDSVKHVADIMSEIAAASVEQASGIEQINQAIAQMDQVTQQNAALVEEAAAASESMQDQAAKLAEAVSVFRLSGNGMASTALTPLFSSAPVSARRVVAPAPRIISQGCASQSRALGAKVPAHALSGGDWEEF